MATQAELNGIKEVAKRMSIRDLEWQIANVKKLRIPADLNKVFKEELAARKKNG
jgi:hypothetical protein